MSKDKITFKEQMEGFPLWQLSVISLIRFAEPIAFTSLFPYVYFMVRDFGVADETEIAKYSGYLSGMFAFFQFLFCVKWSQLSDKIGRKKVLMIGSFGLSLSILLFGFSPNYYVALLARCIMGSLSGNISVIRTVIGEVAIERRHQALAFSILPLFWSFGSVIGPMIGGSKYLTRPKDPAKSPTSFLMKRITTSIASTVTSDPDSFYERFITKHPYALSNIFVSTFLWFSIVIAFLFLEETNYKKKNKRDVGLEIGDRIRRKLGFECDLRPWQKQESSSVIKPHETEPLLESAIDTEEVISVISSSGNVEEDAPTQLYDPVVEDSSSESVDSIGPLSRRMSAALVRRYSSTQPITPGLSRADSLVSSHFDPKETAFTRSVVQTIVANFIVSFHNIVYSEFLPVFLAGDLLTDKIQFPFKIKGGFGWNSSSIGSLLSSTGLMGTLSVLLIFPWIDRNFRTIDGFRVPSLILPFAYSVLPFFIFTLNSYNPKFPPYLSTVLIYSNSCLITFASSVGFPQILLLLHRATNSRNRAYVNGTALSVSALARCVGPMIWGMIVSYTDKHSFGGLSWHLLSFICIIGSLQAFLFLDNYDEDLKETQAPRESV